MAIRTDPFLRAAAVLPPQLRQAAQSLPEEEREEAEELRLRVGWPMAVLLPGGERPVAVERAVTGEDLRTVLEIASQASAHTVLERVRSGFVTIRGGHRIGLCGTAAVEDGRLSGLRTLSSLAVRIARDRPGAAGAAAPMLVHRDGVFSTLILAPPGAGKTTLLRDLIRMLSNGEAGTPLRVGVADERGELAAMWRGAPELDLGRQTDVMDGCPKAQALEMLLRGMNPQVLAMDEITAPEDSQAILHAAGCGVALLATAHGRDRGDLLLRPVYRELLGRKIFSRLVTIVRGGDRARKVRVEVLE